MRPRCPAPPRVVPVRPPQVPFPLTAGLPLMGSRSCRANSPSALRETPPPPQAPAAHPPGVRPHGRATPPPPAGAQPAKERAPGGGGHRTGARPPPPHGHRRTHLAPPPPECRCTRIGSCCLRDGRRRAGAKAWSTEWAQGANDGALRPHARGHRASVEGVWVPKTYQKWPDRIFPIVNFVYSRDCPFGLPPPPPSRLCIIRKTPWGTGVHMTGRGGTFGPAN